MSRAVDNDVLIFGGTPRADLLPPEVKTGRRGKTLRQALALAVVVVIMLVGGGVVWATIGAGQSQQRLEAEQARTDDLLAQQLAFAPARQMQSQVDGVKAARIIGMSTEVDWKAYLGEIKAKLPADVLIDTVRVDSASPLAPYGPATVPLQGPRIATLNLLLTSPKLPTVPAWLESLSTLPGYADATPGSVTRLEGGSYQVNLTLNVNEEVFTNRYAPEDAEGEN